MNISQLIIFGLFVSFIYGCSSEENSQNGDSVELFSLLKGYDSGVDFNNTVMETPDRHFSNFNPVYNGGGVAVGDLNNDDLPDLYFTGNDVSNQLYLNKGGLKFEKITQRAKVGGGNGWHNGVSMADVNADGFLDIYVCRGGWHKDPNLRKNLLFINKGNTDSPEFEEKAAEYGLADAGYSFQSAFFDFDNDGDLDVYVINHPDQSGLEIHQYVEGRANGNVYSKDRLYENKGNNKFEDITEKAGMNGTYGFGLSISTADLDGNGFLDVYVTNDYLERDYMFLNHGPNADGQFTFKESIADQTGHISFFAMGVDIADLNHDGLEDIFVSEMLPEDYKRSKTNMAAMNPESFYALVENDFHHCYMHNTLQLNQGNGVFSEVAQLAGLAKTDWSWACFMTDFDNDGLRDVFVANGYSRDLYDRDAIGKMNQFFEEYKQGTRRPVFSEMIDLFPSQMLENYIFQNKGDLKFEKKTKEWGLNHPSFSNGSTMADLDRDGDLDLVINNLNQEAFVFRNNTEKTGNNYLRVKLAGNDKNPHGLGAKIEISAGGQTQVEQLKINRGYLGTVEPIAHFGLGKTDKVSEVRVNWADGQVTSLANIDANQVVTVAQKDAGKDLKKVHQEMVLFNEETENAFDKIFTHTENEYDDYQNQILLPHRMSQLGPFIAVSDVNGDGLEDFYVGGASNQAGALYFQNENGKFESQSVSAFENDRKFEDLGVLFFDADGDGDSDLYVVSGGTEFPEGTEAYQDRLYLNNGKGGFSKSNNLPNITTSGSCVAAADIDGDSDLDLFVGGRTVPDRYPYPASSHILINENGKFTDQTETFAPDLKEAGMVTSAVWSDLDGNGNPDLMIAGEWMPIKIYENDGTKLTDVSSEYLPTDMTGWWNRIVEHDIDGDGDSDFIAGNLGLNYKFKASAEKPFHVYCDDFDKNGSYDVVLAKYYGKTQVPVRGRECSSEQMPFVAEKFPTFHDFANADLEQIYGDEGLNTALHYEANWFASSVLIKNPDGGFNVEKLPTEAQFSTVQGIVPTENHIVIGGNMFNSEVETTRADASKGLVLNNAGGSLSARRHTQSGIHIPYDVKDLALIKIGKEGKEGILVGSNNDVLRLFVSNLGQTVN